MTARMKSKHHPRRGFAALEIAVFLPFLMVLLVVIFTVASVAVSHTETALQARHAAWTGRHQPWRNASRFRTSAIQVAVPADMLKVLGDEIKLEPHMAVTADKTLEIPVFYLGYQDVFPDAFSEHFVLGGSWDFQEIRFPEKRDHPQLKPTRKFYFFTDLNLDFSVFRGLAGIAPSALLAQQAAARGQHGQVSAATPPLGDLSSPDEVIEAIADKEDELEDIETELQAARAADPPDEAEIRRLENERAFVLRQLRALYRALEYLQNAGRALAD